MSEVVAKTTVPAAPVPVIDPGVSAERKCACGGSAGATSECEECRREKLTLQPKLTVGNPNDRFEREADRVADEVMRMPEAGSDPLRSPLHVQRLSSSSMEGEHAVPPIVHDALRTAGQPLEAGTRGFMERRFGHDFGRIRVHAEGRVAQSAHAIDAKAYTAGSHIVFGPGTFQPGSGEGRRLLAHELAHTVQQETASPPAHVQRQPLEYDTTQIQTTAPKAGTTLAQAKALIAQQTATKMLASATVKGSLAPAGSDAEIFLLHLIAQLAKPAQWGEEADLIVEIGWPPAKGSPAPNGLVTVTFDARGNATAELITAGTTAAPTTHAKEADAISALKSGYGLKDVLNGTATWTLTDLNKVVGAFSLLPSSDKAALKDVVLERVQTLPNSRAGEFDYKLEVTQGSTTAINTATLRLANLAFAGDSTGFVGGTTKSHPASYQTILHEVGHAVSKQKVREKVGALRELQAKQNAASAALNPLVDPLNQAADALNQLVEDYNAADAAGRAKLKPQVDAARKTYNTAKKAYDPKKKASDEAAKKVKTAQTPAAEAQDSQTLLASIDKTMAARKKAADASLTAAEKTASAYQAPVPTESDPYRKAVAEAGQKLDGYMQKLGAAGTAPADVATAETAAVQAIQTRDSERAKLESAHSTNPALTDFAPVVAAQDAWLESIRLRTHVTGEGKPLQGFVDLALRENLQPLTKYARDEWPHNPGEFFAEAYSLWITDPEYLKANLRKLYNWFQAGSYRP